MKQVRPKKNLGQHFLTDLGIAKRIADTVDAYPDIPVLEIGPGMGVMTQYLYPKNRDYRYTNIDVEKYYDKSALLGTKAYTAYDVTVPAEQHASIALYYPHIVFQLDREEGQRFPA